VNTQLIRRVAVGAAAGAVGYLGARLVGRAVMAGADGARRSYVHTVTIYRPPAEVYSFWRDLPSLARALERVVRVDEISDDRSRWIVEGPGSSEIEFMVEILIDEPQRLLAWRAEDSPLPHEGRVEFMRAPGGRGTEVRLILMFLPPAGAYGAVVTSLTGVDPDTLLMSALRRVKQVIEAGEVVMVDGQSSGRDAIPAAEGRV
jgi:uncharacterized membrane protein